MVREMPGTLHRLCLYSYNGTVNSTPRRLRVSSNIETKVTCTIITKYDESVDVVVVLSHTL